MPLKPPDLPAVRSDPGFAAAGDREWHAIPAEAALAALASSEVGLTEEEAERRLRVVGPNRLPQGRSRSAAARFFHQFRNLLIYVLLAAAALSAAIGHPVDSAVILAVVLINALIGYVQEGRAERALEAIRGMIDPSASVIRAGRRVTVAAQEVVPGDMVLIEAGDRVPADLRLVRARGLKIDEAVLTGESVPVEKATAIVAADAPLGDRLCLAFSGSFVAAGQGWGVAVATGQATELGRISALLGAVERLATPLIRQMNQFARQVTVAVLGASILLFAFAVLVRGYALDDAFMAVVGLAVAAIPEGLPAVMTIALAVGVRRMARRKAIVRRLPAVETLGAVSVICSDKTGTLTRNEMAARTLVVPGRIVEVDGQGYEPEGVFRDRTGFLEPMQDPTLAELLAAGLLCNDAHLRRAETGWTVNGDPMEGALVVLASRAGVDPDAARAACPRLDEIPFDSRHRYMATLNRCLAGPVAYVKGAPERVLEMCAVADSEREHWRELVDGLAAGGQRVIALACRELAADVTGLAPEQVESGLRLLGLVGLMDPPREEAVAAVAECRTAGIRIKMITGDHAATARAIAAQLGIDEGSTAVTGGDLDQLEPEDFARHAREAAVFARTSPEHKLRLVESLQAGGAVVAMTGDGVNDAPALKRADIGVAMGRKGTEAAKEASELVLADDNFASIVAAVREGRTVYDNLTKVIAWTLPTNGGEALTIILAVLFGLTLPVAPIQILWINMVTAVCLGLTLAFEPTEPGTMLRPPRPPGRALLSGRLLWRVIFVSMLMVAGAFGVFAWALERGLGTAEARTLVVNAIVVMEIFYLFSVRYAYGASITRRGVLGAPAVWLGIAGVVAAQLAFTYAPPVQAVFGAAAIGALEGIVVVGLGLAMLFATEVEKRIAAALHPRRRASP